MWAANPVLTIQGVGSASGGGDVTAFVDQVEIVQVSTNSPVSGAVANLGFEAFGALGNGNYGYNPSGASWTFNTRSGIAQNGSNFGAPTAPQGSAVAFVQSESGTNGLLQQTLTLGTGTYTVRFQVAQRTCCSPTNDQRLNVLIDGVVVGTVLPTNTAGFTSFISNSFTIDAPSISSLSPTRNANLATSATNVGVTFSQNISAATASGIKVFSSQAGGNKAGAYSTSNAVVTFDPTTDFKAGETVFTTIPTSVQSTGGAANTTKQVYQFTTATGGTGKGNLLPGSDLTNPGAGEVVAADFNGDGILDLADTGGGLQIRLGTGGGNYGTATTYSAAGGGFSLTAGDLDNDGDLDLVVPRSGGTIAVMRNNGAGSFTALTAAASNGNDPRKAALGDIDADGDLDMLVPLSAGGGAVGVYFNNGSGSFSNPISYTGAANAVYVVLGDVDRDGDLDYAVADYNNSRVVVRLNNGSGTFSGGSNVTVGNGPNGLVLADVNGDGALDILVANESTAALSVSLNTNNNTGSFNASTSTTLPNTTSGLAVGDVDADGDLDVVLGGRGATGFYLRLNNGTGAFAGGGTIAASNTIFYLALADLDNDGDLDLAGASLGGALYVRLNQPLAPSITSFAVNPGGLGQAVTITGTNLSGVTSLLVNGVNATASISNNTATSLTFRVPVTAPASGTTTLATAGGTATSTAFTVMPAPGNALAIDNGANYVVADAQPGISDLRATGYTIEAWVYLNAVGGVQSVIRKDGDYNFYIINGLPRTQIWSTPTTLRETTGTTALTAGRWHHVAGTWDGTDLRVYLNGVDITGGTGVVSFTAYTLPLRLGRSAIFNEPLNGRLDEVRIYNTPLALPQIQADMTSTAASVPASLKFHLNFDQGTSAGNNGGLTTLYDLVSAQPATLTNFALTSGNTTSNYVESYAVVVPTATAATAVTATGFTANWTAPTVGTVSNYVLDVSTNATFTAPITNSPFTIAAGTTARALTGLTPSSIYYYRVRADKTSVTGQGAYSNTITVNTPSNVSSLSNLVLSAGAISPAFAPATLNYSLTVPGTTTSTTVTPTRTQANATITVNGITVTSGTASGAIALNPGANTIAVVVTAQDGTTTNYIVTVTRTCALTAAFQNGTVPLDANGNVTVLAAAFNNGSTSTCGPVTATAQKQGKVFGEVGEGGTLTLTAPAGAVFTAVDFASYGTPTGSNGTYTVSGCHSGNSTSAVSSYLLNQNSASIPATNGVFGDPCVNVYKKLAIVATYTFTASSAQLSYSCSDLGINSVFVTLTDAGGNTRTGTTTVTVIDNIAPVAAGTGPLPAAPLLATSNVPEAGNYGVLYQLDVPNVASFNGLTAVPYAVNNSSAAIARPTRVAYFMELSDGATSKWVWASMDNFANTLTELGLPNPTANNKVWSQSVSNLNVFASANAGVTTGTSVGTGRIEMWRWNYTTGNVNNVPGANGSNYDFGDEVNVGSGNYGSFQVHNVTAAQTLLAYNNWGGNGDGGGIGNIGIGNQVGGSGHPDWTFTYNANTFTVKRIYILVPNNSAFTQPATVVIGASGTASLAANQVYTGAIDNCTSANALNVAVSPSTFTCVNAGSNLVTVAVTDGNGNTTTQSAFVTVTVPASTPTTTWNGNANTSWTDCQNWSFGKVPDATTNVIIPASMARYPSLTSGTAATKDLTINNGVIFATGSGATLQINGNLTNNGTATFSGPVNFVGSAATQIVGGSSSITLATATVNKPTGTVQLARDLNIGTSLQLTTGTLTTTSSYKIALSSTATISESETSYVIGNVEATRNLNVAGTSNTFGGMGLTLTPVAGSTALPGSTRVVRTTGTALTGVNSSVSVQRYFDIQATVNTGLNVTMNFAYFNHELNGIPSANLVLFKSVSGISGPWASQNPVTRSTNLVSKTGISGFSIWTLGDAARPLPVELTAFTATPQANAVSLKWRTASEFNNDHFEVERSLTGREFERVANVAGQGTKASPTDYILLDANLPNTGNTLYYRLRQVDADGTINYSPVRVVQLPTAPVSFTVVPTVLTDAAARYQYTGPALAAGAKLEVFSILGQRVWQQTQGVNEAGNLPLSGLASGWYVVRLTTTSGTHQARIYQP